MLTREEKERTALLQGTLDLLILRILMFGPQHGQGALYPALQRLEANGWIAAKWGVSSNNRKARFYSLTKSGKKQLVEETGHWRRLAGAIARVLGPEEQEG